MTHHLSMPARPAAMSLSAFPPPQSSSSAARFYGQRATSRKKQSLYQRAPSASSMHATASASSSSFSLSPSVPRPQTAAAVGGTRTTRGRPPSASHSVPPTSSPSWASASAAAATAGATSAGGGGAVPFCLLDSIQRHQQRGSRSARRNRPGSAQGKRLDSPPQDMEEAWSTRSTSSSSSPSLYSSSASAVIPVSPRDAQRQRQRHRQESEERKEPEDDEGGEEEGSAAAEFTSQSPLGRSPSPLPIQRAIHLLHASPLLARFLPQLSTIDSHWSALIAHQATHRREEAERMRRLRSDETAVRDALLAFLRVSMEYRRIDVHDHDGRVQRDGDRREEDGEVGLDWLVGDDDQSDGLAVDWNGRYWQCERRREKEAWLRREERTMQALYERGVRQLTALYERQFRQLIAAAFDPKANTRRDAQCEQLQCEVQEALTALEASARAEPSSPEESSDPAPSALLPPRHPSLLSYAASLHASLSSLSSLLSSHRLRVSSVIERCRVLTASSATVDAMVAAMNAEERERREELSDVRDALENEREEAARREDRWQARVDEERLQAAREREEATRVRLQMAELQDALQRIEEKYRAEWRRHQDKADAQTQCDASEEQRSESRALGVPVSGVAADADRRREPLNGRGARRRSGGTTGGDAAGSAGGTAGKLSPRSAGAAAGAGTKPRMWLKLTPALEAEPASPPQSTSPRSARSSSPIPSVPRASSPTNASGAVHSAAVSPTSTERAETGGVTPTGPGRSDGTDSKAQQQQQQQRRRLTAEKSPRRPQSAAGTRSAANAAPGSASLTLAADAGHVYEPSNGSTDAGPLVREDGTIDPVTLRRWDGVPYV